MAAVILKKGEGRLLKSGGAWVFDNEIAKVEGAFLNGGIVEVRDFDGYPLGKGYINTRSKIRVRILTRKMEEEIDSAFFRRRLQAAWDYRKRTVDTSSCRIVFGEADFLPGITIDKYEDVLVVEALTLGIDRYKEEIVDLLKEILLKDGIRIRGVYERSDAKERTKEGLERIKGFIGDKFDPVVQIKENGVSYTVDVKDGQKTGFFLDQKYNRRAIQPIAKGAEEVLDCFTHTGSFALNAAYAGAGHVVGVDASASACQMARHNAELNGFQNVEFQTADVLKLLPKLKEEGKQYDLLILDPPAFAKSKANVRNAAKGYKKINRQGMELVRDGGYFATCSCSHFMTRDLFEKMLRQAAREAHVRLKQVECRTQSPDHPILWTNEDSFYLKFYIFQIVRE
jgi:23S rRNA (cytosine1962-C5)-methyltransferase